MLATLGLLAATVICSPVPGHADTRYPVLLVHGGLGSPKDFNLMVLWLIRDGYRPYTVDLDPLGTDTKGNAGRIKVRVERILRTTGAQKVHLVGYSMGGLSTRYYIKILDGLKNVATYTALGTPQHGHPPGCLLVPDQCTNSPVLQDLNRSDDTPGSIYYTSIASSDSEPAEASKWAPLDHGACLPVVKGGPHPDEPRNPVIYQAVKDGLNSTCPSGWTDLPDITP